MSRDDRLRLATEQARLVRWLAGSEPCPPAGFDRTGLEAARLAIRRKQARLAERTLEHEQWHASVDPGARRPNARPLLRRLLGRWRGWFCR